MKRKIVSIDESKCNGCGLCVNACHEGAIELVNGKARLISDEYCDGLGDCLPECPVNAISIIERESKPYNEELVKKKMEQRENSKDNKDIQNKIMPCGCPGTAAKRIERKENNILNEEKVTYNNLKGLESQLVQWPVQISLINTKAAYLDNADLLIAADCTAYAYGNFHNDFIKDHITMIGCPKLDNIKYYKEKFIDILSNHNIKSITVVRMEVPCCGGIISAIKKAMLDAETIVPYREVIITTDGKIK